MISSEENQTAIGFITLGISAAKGIAAIHETTEIPTDMAALHSSNPQPSSAHKSGHAGVLMDGFVIVLSLFSLRGFLLRQDVPVADLNLVDPNSFLSPDYCREVLEVSITAIS